jgi:hypothetical protein
MREVASMPLLQMAAALREGALTYEQVAQEYARRTAAGLDPDTGRAPSPAGASSPFIPAIECPHCGALTRARIAPGSVCP